MSKNRLLIVTIAFMTIGHFGCASVVDAEVEETVTGEEEIVLVENGKDHDYSGDYIWDTSEEIQITLKSNAIGVYGNGAVADGNTVTITSAGTYRLTGSLENGQIIVNSSDEEIVRLIFNSIDITCSSSAPVYIVNAEKVMIVLADNTENFIADGSSYILADTESGEPNAAVFSKSDLTIYGTGTLKVDANYRDGIASKDGLIIASGMININSKDDGIRGKDYLIINDGNIYVKAGGVGLKSTNDNDASMGYITVNNGMIDIFADENAIEAKKDVTITSGKIILASGEFGIDAAIRAIIDGGTIQINSEGDAVHSNGLLIINDGSFVIASGDDGFHADNDLVINKGEINITKSYEGIESADGDITINGGAIHLVSQDDGINLAAGGDSGPGWASTDSYLYINNGYVFVNANGDGVDANASIVMAGGNLIVSGSTAINNSALDFNGSFIMNGGFLVAAGSYSRMTQALSTSSSQNSILINLTSAHTAGKLIHVQTQAGAAVLTFSPAKSYQSVAFSSSELTTGTTFNIYLGGSSTGTPVDGLYKDGTYSGGTLYKSFTISSRVTTVQ